MAVIQTETHTHDLGAHTGIILEREIPQPIQLSVSPVFFLSSFREFFPSEIRVPGTLHFTVLEQIEVPISLGDFIISSSNI